MYINATAKHLLSLTRLFADNSQHINAAAHISDIACIIHNGLQLLTNWARQWLVTYNPLKPEFVLFALKYISFRNLFLIIFKLLL